MNVVTIRPDLQKGNLVAAFDVQADARQHRLNRLNKNRAPVLGRADQVIQQNRGVVALVDVFTHAPS